jgi:hypothetical protein
MSSNPEDAKELASFSVSSDKYYAKDLMNRAHLDQLKSSISGKKQNVLLLYDSSGRLGTELRVDEEIGIRALNNSR